MQSVNQSINQSIAQSTDYGSGIVVGGCGVVYGSGSRDLYGTLCKQDERSEWPSTPALDAGMSASSNDWGLPYDSDNVLKFMVMV